MITAISPSSYDYEETLSSLKYADRAKRVRMRVDANVTSGLMATDKSAALELVPILQAEVQKLRELLRQQQQQQELPIDLNASINTESSEMVQEMRERVRELEKQLAEREKLIESLDAMRRIPQSPSDLNSTSLDNYDTPSSNVTGSSDMAATTPLTSSSLRRPSAYSQLRLSLTDSINSANKSNSISGSGTSHSNRSQPIVVLSDDAVDVTLPRVVNLNQDPLFSECLVYYIPEGSVMAGSKSENADILLTGPDIVPQHCILHHDQQNGDVHLEVLKGSVVFVNGDLIPPSSERVKLRHFDRIAFGRFHLFRFDAKGYKSLRIKTSPRSENSATDSNAPNWEYAQEELLRKNDASIQFRINAIQEGEDGVYSMQTYQGQQQQQQQSPSVNLFKSRMSGEGLGGTDLIAQHSNGGVSTPLLTSNMSKMGISEPISDFSTSAASNMKRRVSPSPPLMALSSAGTTIQKQEFNKSSTALQEFSSSSSSLPQPPPPPPPSSSSSSSSDSSTLYPKASVSPDRVTKKIFPEVETKYEQTSTKDLSRVEFSAGVLAGNTVKENDDNEIAAIYNDEISHDKGRRATEGGRNRPTGSQYSPRRHSSFGPGGPDDPWWARLNRVAEGQEKADPAELRAMLKSVVERAEERVGKKKVIGSSSLSSSTDSLDALKQNKQDTSSLASAATVQVPANKTSPSLTPFPVVSSSGANSRADISSAPATTSGTRNEGNEVKSIDFEREASALQGELAAMQKTLQERMKRYSVLTNSR